MMDEGQTEFEEGKQVEDYVAELDALKIEEEPNPESEQRLETIVSPPIRNEKKKTSPLAKPIVKEEPVIVPPQKVEVTQQNTSVDQIPVVEAPKIVESVPQQASQQQQTFSGLDDYIDKAAESMKQQWRTNAYQTLFGVASGQLQVVPVQQAVEQPQAQQQPQGRQLTKEDLREIVREELPNYIPTQPKIQEQPTTPKTKKTNKLKMMLALCGVICAFAVAAILALNSLLH
jgi:hypothetical protein